MNGSEHYREGERLLSQASLTDRHGNPVNEKGTLLMPGAHEAVVRRAMAHFAAAQAAATALGTVTGYVGDSDEITAWARITGILPARTDVMSRPCEFENHASCIGCSCICHLPKHTCVPFGTPEQRRAECAQCRVECQQCTDKEENS